ncbi:ABC transporter substrate-binding protein [Rhodococcus globerulus]|uniref:ABC transporter substrate-binding protein n=1 Tax=Rhodococcus globerulus TaxID=33008 RepID=A0ABU4C4R7_RHOGO|nr:ABC transporter substrate-binding protein [Rhodococcus globerulus]MDV6271208.1 ABC transporter substrate-binding protein [Rhodococcus globerulus]
MLKFRHKSSDAEVDSVVVPNHPRRVTRKSRRIVAALATIGVIAGLTACSSGNDKDTTSSGSSESVDSPVRGGTPTIGLGAPTPGFDPAKLANAGATTGTLEQFALYDVLVRLDRDTGKYEMRTAESVEPNSDFTKWTLKIKPGIKFSDGTPYDANAVKFVHDREIESGVNPAKSYISPSGFVKSISVVDDLTVEYDLNRSWAGFPFVLGGVNGIIYSPTAFAKAGSADAFNLNPGDAGAGPFTLKSYTPGESVQFVRNDNYYGGDVPLDGLTFKKLDGAPSTFQAVKTGSFDAGFVRDPSVLADAEKGGFDVVKTTSYLGNIAAMNGGNVICKGNQPQNVCEGKPDGSTAQIPTATSNPTVRKAVAAALDPSIVNNRAFADAAVLADGTFGGTNWDPQVPFPGHDLDNAKKLVEQAKSEGWDGKIRVLSQNDPAGTAWGQAVSAQLKQAGFDVTCDCSVDLTSLISKVLSARDYDVVNWGFGISSTDFTQTFVQLQQAISASNSMGFVDEGLAKSWDDLGKASTPDEQRAALTTVAERWNDTMPAVPLVQLPTGLIVSGKLHGLELAGINSILFDKAWLS